MSAKTEVRKVGIGILVTVVIAGVIFALPLTVGVWLPDVLFASPRILAEQRTADGSTIRVIQYWNRVDFYTTELHIVLPNGKVDVRVLDGDDSKSWRIPLIVDQDLRTISVMLSGNRERKETW